MEKKQDDFLPLDRGAVGFDLPDSSAADLDLPPNIQAAVSLIHDEAIPPIAPSHSSAPQSTKEVGGPTARTAPTPGAQARPGMPPLAALDGQTQSLFIVQEPDRSAHAATEMQKLLFAVQTVNRTLGENARCKILVVVGCVTNVKRYVRYLQQRCIPLVRAQPVFEDDTVLSLEHQFTTSPANVLVVTICTLANAISSDQVRLELFHMMLLDHPFTEDDTYSSALLIALEWGLLPDTERPLFVDLFSKGRLPPPNFSISSQATPSFFPALGGAAAPDPPAADARAPAPPKPAAKGPPEGGAANDQLLTKGMAYPYWHASGCEVNILNCMGIFLGNCLEILGEYFFEEELFRFRWDDAKCADVLTAVSYPSPEGPVTITQAQVDAAWAGRTLQDVLDLETSTSARPRPSGVEKRWFVYVAVMDMIWRGYLDMYNNLTPQALTVSTLSTWLAGRPPRPKPKKQKPAPASTALTEGDLSRGRQIFPLPQQTSPWMPNYDPKSLLNQLQHKYPDLVVNYNTVNVSDRSHVAAFRCTVSLMYHDQVLNFAGSTCIRKKFAEKTAALAAMRFLIEGDVKGALHMETDTALADIAAAVTVPPTLTKKVQQAWYSHKTAKMQLNEQMQQLSRTPTGKPAVWYTCQAVEGGWKASVCIARQPNDQTTFTGDVATSKKESEESAALRALQSLALGV